MRFYGITPAVLLAICAGCTCGPNYYGPGLLPRNPYGSCIDNKTIAPPIPLGANAKHHKPTLAERQQQRDLRRWYKELESPHSGHHKSDTCPHCRRKLRHQANSFESGPYDEMAFHDGQYFDGQHFEGQIVDGQYMTGGEFGGTYPSGSCPECENQTMGEIYESAPHGFDPNMGQPYHGEPALLEPSTMPAGPPVEPSLAPAPPAETEASINEYYAPRIIAPGSRPELSSPVRQVSIPPVEQMLYAPPVQP